MTARGDFYAVNPSDRSWRRNHAVWFALLTAAMVLVQPQQVRADEIRFSRDVRPILSDHCFTCHGPDEASREADLRLDQEAGLKPGSGDDHAVIFPGFPDRSELVTRLLSDDPDVVMPPPDSVKQLSPSQKRLIVDWIRSGADWEEHWAYQSMQAPKQDFEKPRLAIDHFIDDRLRQSSLSPNPLADPSTWLRRVTLSLTGLPPSRTEIQDFQSNPDLEDVVDRLLNSTAYGERMAWDWLDAARYADTHGYQKDNVRTMWAWRDWVIDAFNDNLPYDQFIIDQLAGDLLPDATLEQKIATGFSRNHRINAEAGSIDEEFRTEYVIDRTDTMATLWMGMTAGCARCHDHKFDPLSQREYYQLFAFFNNVEENGRDGVAETATPDIEIELPGYRQKIATARLAMQRAESDLSKKGKLTTRQFQDWLAQQRSIEQSANFWLACTPDQVNGTNKGSTFKVLPDDSVQFGGANPLNDVHDFQMEMPTEASIHSLRLEAIPDPAMTGGGFARSFTGNFLLSEVRLLINGQPIPLQKAVANTESLERTAAMAIDGDPLTGWSVERGVRRRAVAKFQLKEPYRCVPGDVLVLQLCYESREEQFIIGRFRISLGIGVPSEAELSSRRLRRIVQGDQEGLRGEFLEEDSAFAELRISRSTARERVDELVNDSTTRVMVMRERKGPVRQTHVLQRGLYDQLGEPVSADTPSFLGLSLPQVSPPDRLTLARWLTDPRHPLTARVAVNRLWKQIFGTGLVKTANDFGYQGERPSHPVLLDWMATDFIRSGWNVKRLLREMVLSEAYQRGGRVRPDLLEIDPENRLLARWSRPRLSAPMLRDQALFLSGLMNRRVGGPPVKPWQPDGLWQVVAGVNSNTTRYVPDTSDALFRRSLYTFWKRGMPPPNMVIFDAANREICSVGRSPTNSPLQALTSLNDPCFAVPAIVLADRVLEGSSASGEGDDLDEKRLHSLWRWTQATVPNKNQLSVLLKTLHQHEAVYKSNSDLARQRVAPAANWIDESRDSADLASYTEIAEIILNLDSTLTNN